MRQKLLYMSMVTAWLAVGCAGLKAPDLPVRYHSAQYAFTFCLPASWEGYSVLMQPWDGETYSIDADKLVITGRGQLIVFRNPQWKAGAAYQDIPILVFTRAQWEALQRGELWPSLYARGTMDELWHNRKYVFGISSRYNAAALNGWKEVAEIVEQNRDANNRSHWRPE